MTDDRAMDWAREVWEGRAVGADPGHIISRIQAALLTAVAEEREACAALAESRCREWEEEGDGESVIASQALYGMAEAGRKIARTIRARSQPGN